MSVEWLWRLAGRQAGPRDGQGLNLEALDLPAMDGAAAPTPTSTRRDGVEATLALKVLSAHLANFRQVSFPLTLDFRSFSAEEAALAVDAAALALEADEGGWADATRRERARETLTRLGASPSHLAPLEHDTAAPVSIGALADTARRLDKAAHAYAVSLLVIGQRSAVAQAYLTYLAARLGLTANVVGSLNRRFRA
ncbi:DUF533 domain-containing protein [Aureimonas phyllosphaerae]|uniref:Uncharacterized protein n=1 Tax=Aureimonas phyllosphaerae TaxID=1166078 RepID=A0A7W6FV84_9HYPH|nr:DUF533 domain-containing protein [Aureimonas phyllosphaerae]MBB3936886.1 hypothetical protein [Aureimonas phyllosphaerae]MBB3960999.1 hypothetical protein [Aureimonas phyllosphaerae]SFF27061.1 Protein of unknown function [Aureimonas phyllosphaerae]